MPVALQETTPGGWREPGSQLEGLDLHTSHPHLHLGNLGFPGGSVVRNPLAVQETWVRSLGQEDPMEKEMAAHSSTLAWKIL